MTAAQVRVEDGPKRIRAVLGGQVVADTTRVKLVWEKPFYPTYYFPAADVRTDLLTATGQVERSTSRGDAELYTVAIGDRRAEGAATWHRDSPAEGTADTIRLDWGAMDAWFEEDEEVYVHARSPYTRVDVLQSSRHVRIQVDGVTVAESTQPRLLFETGLPTRYYLPKTDVHLDLLAPSTHTSQCPYKGTAEYYDVTVGGTTRERLAWWYRHPAAESARIAGYVAFYDEHVDVFVDGEQQEQPRTLFSRQR